MTATQAPLKEEKGLSAHQLILMFLAAVAVCGVFFAAGFLVGYNERSVKSAPITERVSASPSVIPPVVNPTPTPETGRTKEATVTEGNPIRQSAEPLKVPPLPSGKPSRKASEKPAPKPVPPAVGPGASEGFNIQVSASGTEAEAEKVVVALKAEGYPAFITPLEARPGGATLYRVQVGPYPSREEAEKVRDKLAQAGFKEPFIKH
jgi:DedD protein